MTIPSPTTPRAPPALSHATPQRPLVPGCRRSRFRLYKAGSSLTSGRIEFVILRTGHSPSIALHLASRRRSYRWVRAGERMPGEDFHLSDMAPLQAHLAPREARWGRPLAGVQAVCSATASVRLRSASCLRVEPVTSVSPPSGRRFSRRGSTSTGSAWEGGRHGGRRRPRECRTTLRPPTPIAA